MPERERDTQKARETRMTTYIFMFFFTTKERKKGKRTKRQEPAERTASEGGKTFLRGASSTVIVVAFVFVREGRCVCALACVG